VTKAFKSSSQWPVLSSLLEAEESRRCPERALCVARPPEHRESAKSRLVAIPCCTRRLFGDHLRVGGQSEQRKILAIHVVLQIEHARESRAGVVVLVPRAVLLLSAQEVGNTARHGIAADVIGGHHAENGPSGLRRGALANSLPIRIVVRIAGLAPSAVRILHHAQPF